MENMIGNLSTKLILDITNVYIITNILQQGACIVSEEDKRIISVGFSGYPARMKKPPERRGPEDIENLDSK